MGNIEMIEDIIKSGLEEDQSQVIGFRAGFDGRSCLTLPRRSSCRV